MSHCMYCEMDGPHAATCITHWEKSPAGRCDCGQKYAMAKARMWRAMGWLELMASKGRVLIECDEPANLSWREPDGAPWTVTIVGCQKGTGTLDDELGEDEWERYAGSSLEGAIGSAWADIYEGHIDSQFAAAAGKETLVTDESRYPKP